MTDGTRGIGAVARESGLSLSTALLRQRRRAAPGARRPAFCS